MEQAQRMLFNSDSLDDAVFSDALSLHVLLCVVSVLCSIVVWSKLKSSQRADSLNTAVICTHKLLCQ